MLIALMPRRTIALFSAGKESRRTGIASDCWCRYPADVHEAAGPFVMGVGLPGGSTALLVLRRSCRSGSGDLSRQVHVLLARYHAAMRTVAVDPSSCCCCVVGVSGVAVRDDGVAAVWSAIRWMDNRFWFTQLMAPAQPECRSAWL